MTPLKMIESFYSDRRAKRSGVPLIAHIYDGSRIIESNYPLIKGLCRSVGELTNAFCLHPLLQDPEELESNIHMVLNHLGQDYLPEILLALEYRKLANSYLCRPSTDHYSIDSVSRLLEFYSKDVALLLYADKVQNMCDFELFHLNAHDRSKELENYFTKWINALDVRLFSI